MTKTKREPNPLRVCVLETEEGEQLILRSDPPDRAVRSFVKLHHTRNPGDYAEPTYHVTSATYFESEYDIEDPDLGGDHVKLSDL